MSITLLAIDFGGTKSAIAISDLDGNILRRVTISVADCIDANDVLGRAIKGGLELLHEVNAENTSLRGIGLSTMGITEADGVLMAPNITGWEKLRIEAAIHEGFPGVPVRIENDMKASALAELRRGSLRGTSSGLYVNLGTGFGTALTYGNEVIRGAHGAAGEMAYNLRSSADIEGYRDGVTPLENLLGGRGIGQRASKIFGKNITARDAFELAGKDEKMRGFIESTIREMAFHVTNFVISWDPEKVVFGGGMTSSSDWFIPVIQRFFAQFVPFPPEVDIAYFRNDAGLFGAIELAVDAAKGSLQNSDYRERI